MLSDSSRAIGQAEGLIAKMANPRARHPFWIVDKPEIVRVNAQTVE